MASMRRDGALRQLDRLFGEGTLAGLSDARLLERYVTARDDSAFEALVARHGPMVLSVCRRVLADPNDADDAFQAVFLLLARKARSIWVEGSIGGWLHRVAWRIAVQLREDAARRRDQERRAVKNASEPVDREYGRDDTAAVIHQEIERLPERYRQPVVLCFLEDMTYQQAADHLHWTEATTRGRLSRARDLLRARLTRRGITLAGAGLIAVGERSLAAVAMLPEPLLRLTARGARQVVLGDAAAVSSSSIALMRQAARGIMIARLRASAAMVFTVATLAGLAVGVASAMGKARPDAAAPQAARALRSAAQPTKGQEDNAITFRGRVLTPDGRPAKGAGIYTAFPRENVDHVEPELRARTDGDGMFRFTLAREAFQDATASPWSALTVLAMADGFGPSWVDVQEPPTGELALRLIPDDVPIVGRILDLQGRPVVGAKVVRGQIRDEGAAGLDAYLKLLGDDPMAASNRRAERLYQPGYALPGQPWVVETDAQGRFRIGGIGRDQIVALSVEAPTIQSASITVMTRDAADVSTPKSALWKHTIHGARFDYLAPPGRALTGVVKDRRTGQPIAGVWVAGKGTNARTKTDADGRYTLPGFAKGRQYGLMVMALNRPPYFVTCRSVPDTAGLDPIRADVDCEPGIPLRLKLIDRETGKPPRRVQIGYMPLYPNPHTRDVPGYAPVGGGGAYSAGVEQADGTYLLGVLPGPGAVLVRAYDGLYRPACVDPAAFFRTGPRGGSGRFGDRKYLVVARGVDGRSFSPQDLHSAIVLVNPPEDSGPISAEAVLERDNKREVRVLDPDGKLAPGVTAVDFAAPQRYEGIEPTGRPGVMSVWRLNPMRPRRFLFRHDARKLAGSLVARGDEAEPYTVKLQPWATLTGRIVDAKGNPTPNVILMRSDWDEATGDPARGVLPTGLRTDREGRFRIDGLIPGQEYTAMATSRDPKIGDVGPVIDHAVLKPDEVRDLGDIRPRGAGMKGAK